MKNLKTLLLQVKYDFIQGTCSSWYKYLPIIIVTIFLCLNLNQKIQNAEMLFNMDLSISFSDYFLNIFNGIGPITITTSNSDFKIPVSYLLYNLYLVLILCYYPYKDFRENGYRYILTVGNKLYWWISKQIWAIVNIFIYYFLIILVFYIFSLMNGNPKIIAPNNYVLSDIVKSGVNYGEISNIKNLIFGIFVIIIVSSAITMISNILSLLYNPIVGIVGCVVIFITSLYFCNDFLLGNYLMIERLSLFSNQLSVNVITGTILSILAIILTVNIGYVLFKNKDIIGRIGK